MLQFLLHVSIHNMQCMISLPFLCVLLPVHPMPVLYLNKCTYRHTFFEILVGDTGVRGLTRGLATSKVQPGDLVVTNKDGRPRISLLVVHCFCVCSVNALLGEADPWHMNFCASCLIVSFY